MDVAILGGGYAGVVLARRLERSLPRDVSIRLVDESGMHVIQHELHRLIRYPDLVDALAIPLEEMLDRPLITEDRVTGVDLDTRTFRTEDGEECRPAHLAVCLGARTADYGLPGVDRYGLPLKRIEHARAIRQQALELDEHDRVVIGGAGLSGVQVAGELAALREDIEVVVLEQAVTIAPTFPRPFRRAVRERLVDAGIDVRTGTAIREATGTALRVAGDGRITYDCFVWTGGIAGVQAVGRRPRVRADLRVADRTFVLGDAGRVVDDRGTEVPASAQTAIGQAHTAAENIDRLVRAARDDDRIFEPRLRRYVEDTPGWVVSIGDDAVAHVGGTVLTGPPAVSMKAAAGVRYLTSVGRVRESIDLLMEELDAGVAPFRH